MRNPIIAALDVPTAEQALKLAEQIARAVGAFKIGKELFVATGPDIVRRVRATGASVFLDLKFHDIPNTVAKAVATAVRLDVQMLTVHTSGGGEMMHAAEASAQDTAKSLGLQRQPVRTASEWRVEPELHCRSYHQPDDLVAHLYQRHFDEWNV